MSEPHDVHAQKSSSLGARLAGLLLKPQSMVVLDLLVLVFGVATIIYAILRFTNIIGHQSFIEDCSFTVDVFDGMADIFVVYGVALESRAHLINTVFKSENSMSHQLNGVSEHTGIVLVVLGLMLELAAHFGLLAEDIKVADWTLIPLCILGLTLVAITLHQIYIHLISVLKALRNQSTLEPGPPDQ